MRVLSHRGMWNQPPEKNTEAAFRRSFENGFGTETDLRDRNGRVVISHDPPVGECITFERFLQIHQEIAPQLPLALNIKSDGLQRWVGSALREFNVQDYFLFDMSVPSMRWYLNEGLKVYGRVSELEREPPLKDRCRGIWLDSFESDWFESSTLAPFVQAGLEICIVSPELHGRDPWPLWEELKSWSLDAMICTDKPVEAQAFFFVP